MYRLLLLLILILLLTFVSTLHARIIHVHVNFPTIQEAINYCVDGDTVLVADVTYTGDGNHDIDFTGKAIVLMSENGPEVTVIDCEEVERGFKFHSGEDSTSILQGFTLTNGYASRGGGMYNSSSSPLVTNCTFSENSADSGGGMFNGSSSPTVTNCILWGGFPDEISNYYVNPIVTYSDVQGGYPGTGNIDVDPLFMTYKGYDYLLNVGSPCIDTGAPTIDDGISDWYPRWPDWLPNGPEFDMGAYGGPGNKGWVP